MSLSTQQKKYLAQFKGKKILLLGLAREGLSTLAFLRRHLPSTQAIALADQTPLDQFSPPDQKTLTYPHNQLHLGSQYLDSLPNLDSFDYIFKTPGISPYLSPFKDYLDQSPNHHFLSQTQLFFNLCPAPIIGITGTKGKSTTSSLIHHILSTNNLPAKLLGNIGIPPLSQLEEITAQDIIVLELSSHQLLDLSTSPHIAVLQDINPEHLDYYPSFKEYKSAKSNLVKFQTPQDYLIFNDEFKQPCLLADTSPAQRLIFHSHPHQHDNSLLYFQNQTAYYQPDPNKKPTLVSLKKISLKGQHNLQNIAPAIIIGFHHHLGADQIQKSLESFTSLPHRLEFVTSLNQISFYNDSMGTVPEASIAALQSFNDQPVILLAGGSEKNSDYHLLAKQILSQNVKAVLLFPPTGERIASALQELITATTTKNKSEIPSHLLPQLIPVLTMSQAVTKAYQLAKPGDVVLLSPASASFGIFKNYADRGEQFVKAVQSLI